MENFIIIAIFATSFYLSYTMAEVRGRNGMGYGFASCLLLLLVPFFLLIIGKSDAKVMEDVLEAIDRNTD